MKFKAFLFAYLFVFALLSIFLTPPLWAAIGIDTTVSGDQDPAAATVSTPVFSTTSGNELLLAFISTDQASSPNTSVGGIAGAGLTWVLVQRTNVQLGTSEIWRALSSSPLTNVTVTAALSQNVASSITVISFTGADVSGSNGSGGIGAVGGGNASSGPPTATLVTTRDGSMVFGVGNDYDNPIARTPGVGQSLVHQHFPPVGDTYWVQMRTGSIPLSGTSITINDTAPTSDRYNLSIVEVLASPSSGPSTFDISGNISPPLSGNGTSVTLSQGGSPIATAMADGSGNYSFSNLANGTYTLTPSKTGYSFNPVNQNVVVNGADLTGINFAAIALTWTISGTITGGGGASVVLTQGGPPIATVIADVSGAYNFTDIADGTYTVTPNKSGVSFIPVSQNVVVNGAIVSGVNFAAVTNSTYTIWPNTAVPGLVDGGSDNPVELGVKFRSDVNGSITGIRFYKASANTGTHVGHLWTTTGTLLATATFTGETASGWQQVIFSSPVPITANTVYVASYHVNTGHYSADVNYFTGKGMDSPPLHALANGVSGGDGVYVYGSTSSFPNLTWNSANYWVDVVFSPAPTATLTSITVTPSSPTIVVGGTQPFTATGNYSDGSTLNLTNQVTWGSSNTNVATITGSGVAMGVSPGSVTTSATQGSITGNTTLTVLAAPLSITTTTLPGGTQNVAYSANLAATGGTTPYTWTVASGSLPSGLFINSNTGVISGTPTTAGTFNFTVRVTDMGNPVQTTTRALSIQISATLTSITVTPGNPTIVVGGTQPFTATGNYSDGSTLNLTSQVTWGSSNTNVATITTAGVATGVGTGSTTISAGLSSITGSTTLTVLAAPLSITTTTLPGGTQNVAYSANLAATGGTTPYTWTVASGSLPTNLFLNSNTGVISGTPTAAGTFNFTVRVTDSGNPVQTTTNGLNITIGTQANYTIWPNTAVPGLVDGGSDNPVELGVKFRSDVNGSITGIRFYKASANTGTHVGHLWTNTGTLLATATFTGETASGWQQVNFASPVFITANTVYVASYHVNTGHYSADVNYFTGKGMDSPPLHALANGVSGGDGVYVYGSTSSFPNLTWNSANYWVDVVFSPAPTATLTSITVTPGNPTIVVGGTQPFTATGNYSDGSTLNLTSQVTWGSSNTNVATITTAGVATGVGTGSTTISAGLSSITGSTTLTVLAAPLSITTTTLPGGTQNVAYSANLAATGGTTPYTWTVASGSLPSGLFLNSNTGVISGTPTLTGIFSFTVRVSDGAAQSTTKPFSIQVAASNLLYPDLRDIIPTGKMSIVQTANGREFRYTHDTLNGGPGPFVIQPVYNSASGSYQGTQYIYSLSQTGVWSLDKTIPIAGAFFFDSAHGHFHFPLVTYGLYTVGANGGPGAPASLSAKTAFCIDDSFMYDPTLPNAGALGNLGSCLDPTSLRGINIGAVDEYDQTDEGQSISINGLSDGVYWLKALVDPNNFLAEPDKTNNETDVQIRITGTTIQVLSTVVPVLSNPPNINLTSPANGATIAGTVQLTASTPMTSGVQFLIDGQPLGGIVTVSPYNIFWDTTTVPNGTHWLAAQTTDPSGIIGTSGVALVTVSNSGISGINVQLASPVPGSILSATVSLDATVASGQAVAGVQFFLDYSPLGSPITSAPYMMTWDTTTVPDGQHVITVSATDVLGNVGNSVPVSLSVDNSHPAKLIGKEVVLSVDGQGTITTPSFSTTIDGDLLVAFVAYDGPFNSPQTATVSGGGLIWSLLERSNTQYGTSEIWSAQTDGTVSNITVTSMPGTGSSFFHGSLTVIAFTNAAGTGVVGRTGAPSGTPDIPLPGVFAGNWVFAVGNDWDNAIARTAVSGQVLVHQRVDTQVGDTFWVQSTSAPSPVNGLVDIHDSAPTTDQWNYAAVEIVADH